MEVAEHACPKSMAKHLARYISDPSTIRARVMDEFGRAPSKEECARLRERAEQRRSNKLNRPEVFPCGCAFSYDTVDRNGNYVCAPCREKERDARAEEARQASERQAQKIAEARMAARLARLEVQKLMQTALEHGAVLSVCAALGLTREQLISPSRLPYLVDARMIVAKLLRDRGMSYPRVAHFIGRNCHTTVINLIERYDARVKKEPSLATVYESLKCQ